MIYKWSAMVKEYQASDESEEELLKYFVDGYEINERYLRIVPSRKYLQAARKIRWVTVIRTLLQPTKSCREKNSIIYLKDFKQGRLKIETRKEKEILLIEGIEHECIQH